MAGYVVMCKATATGSYRNLGALRHGDWQHKDKEGSRADGGVPGSCEDEEGWCCEEVGLVGSEQCRVMLLH